MNPVPGRRAFRMRIFAAHMSSPVAVKLKTCHPMVLSLIASVVSHFSIAVASMLVCCGMLGMRATVTVWRGTRQPSRKNLDPVLHLPSTAINHELC